MRLKNARALGASGALLSTPMLGAMPPDARSDVPYPPPTALLAPMAMKASSTLSVRSVRRTVMAGDRVVVRGALRPAGAGRAVALQVRRPGGWTTVDHDRTDGHGRYVLLWRASSTGTNRVRVHFGGTRELTSARELAGTARVYRPAMASWYGPGFYGHHLACGGTLTTATLGVAHKWLPCGTKVTLYYHGRMVRVPVIDRGPYVSGREFDLTGATKEKLGFGSTGIVLTTI